MFRNIAWDKPVDESILSAIGNTPLVRLAQVFRDMPFRLYAKLELLNPAGSTKDRPAMLIIKDAMKTGRIGPETVVVESSSGNMGIGLAQVCSYLSLRFICVVDPKVTSQNIRLLEAYGAEIDFVSEPDPETGEYLQARLNRVHSLVSSMDKGFWPNQYANLNNSRSHHQTMREIATTLDGKVDYLFCAASTCGTLRGCAEYIRIHDMKTKIFAVDAAGSVIFGGQNQKRLIPGHGAAVRPELYQPGLIDRCIHITDLECVVGCRRLAKYEAVLAGGSSGAVLMAVEQVKHDIEADSTCVGIFPDRGERYLDTIYSDSWVLEHFGEVSALYREVDNQECATATSSF
jgi:N-(2-amino-2-carboxyethyl)-L-glutamate synthase